MSSRQFAVYLDMRPGCADVSGRTFLRPGAGEKLPFEAHWKVLADSHALRGLRVQHDAAVAFRPAGGIFHPVSGQFVLEPQDVMGVGDVGEEVTELHIEGFVSLVVRSDLPVFDAKGIAKILSWLVTGDLHRPAGEIVAIEEADPAIFGETLRPRGKEREEKQHKGQASSVGRSHGGQPCTGVGRLSASQSPSPGESGESMHCDLRTRPSESFLEAATSINGRFMRIRNRGIFLFIAGYHLLLIVLLPLYIQHFAWSSLLILGITYFLGGISITAGYHRLFSHKSYEAHPWLERFVLFFSTLAFQASALMWSHDHRLHHRHVDTDEDPYSIEKGFWYAHIGWLFTQERKYQPAIVRDLEKNPRVMFQYRHIGLLTLLSNGLVFGLSCLVLHPWAAFYATVLLRIFALHHSTWFINSLAHTWGAKTYVRELSAVDNAILAVLTFGEGYHNYHHAFASDYRNGVRWYHYDVTKWTIWLASKLGFARRLRSVSDLRIRQQLVKKDRELLLSVLPENDPHLGPVREQIERLANSFDETAKQLSRQLHALKSATEDRRQQLLDEIHSYQDRIRSDWKRWQEITQEFGHLVPSH